MRIDILTVVPELLVSPLNESILKRAQEGGFAEIHIHNIRDYSEDKHHKVDDYPFGGEAGMVMKIEPVFRCIEKLKSERHYYEIIFTSPDGIRYDQHEANRLSTLENIIILCGHYKGIDYRIREHLITREISVGDYVLTGGELAAAIITDSVVRLLPGAIGDEASALTDCFQDDLLAPPVYTRPAEFNGWKVPDVLLSGNFAEIHIHNIRDYSEDKHHKVDDYPFGGEAGMVMKIEPVFRCIEKLKSERHYDEIIFTSPDGIRYDQHEANRLSTLENIIILCGHYKGIDYRIREHLITREISVGDYVLTGGELAAAIITDSVVRLLPGAIGDEASALTDCFQDDLLAPPVYTRPAEFNGWKVPDVLLSGNFAEIAKWQETQAYERTKLLRPDLLEE